jgi:predicted phosphate transport protein (TIGR00153 family)
MVSSTTILKMFGRSPIRPLQKHMEKACACVERLPDFFQATFHEKWSTAEKIQTQISRFETDADRIKVELKLHLPKGLFLPMPRADLIYLLTKQEDIANRAEDIAGLILGRKMRFPDFIFDLLAQYVQTSVEAVKQATKAINELDELLEVGFRGKVVKLVTNMIHNLNKIETKSDHIQIDLRKKIFDIEDKLQPINVIFIYKVIEWIADLSDCAEKVGAGLQILLAR